MRLRVPTALALLAVAVATPSAAAREALEPGQVPAPAPPPAAFPVDGDVAWGYAEAGFGGGRGHMGQDVFAACGTPVLAVADGEVIMNKTEGAAGNYVVVETPERRSQVYMHLRAPARPAVGERVVAGERLGSVGDTGDASECHLHFELWTAPGWYRGGHAVDPLPLLKRLR